MSWKEDLVKKINDLSDKDFIEGKAVIMVSFSVPWRQDVPFLNSYRCVNLYPVGWVGPGYLLLDEVCSYRNVEDVAIGVLKFVVSRDRKHNEITVTDIMTGYAWASEMPIFASIDFMSL